MSRHSCTIAALGTLAAAVALVAWWTVAVARPERLNDDLAAAIRRKDAHGVLDLLRQGAKADAWREGDRSESDWAPYRPMLLLALASQGVPAHGYPVPAPFGTTKPAPAHPAPGPSKEIVTMLLDHGADPNRGDDQELPIGAASRSGDVQILRLLVARGARVGGRPAAGDTALALAATPAMAEELIRLGADIDARSAAGGSPLSAAVGRADAPLVRCLLRHHPDLRGQGLVAQAVSADSAEMLRDLLAAGCDPSERDRSNMRPLDYAVQGQPGAHLRKMLLQHGAK